MRRSISDDIDTIVASALHSRPLHIPPDVELRSQSWLPEKRIFGSIGFECAIGPLSKQGVRLMQRRDYSDRDDSRRFGWAFALVFVVPQFAAADPPQSTAESSVFQWSEELPAVETRITWAWPDFLFGEPKLSGDAASVPLSYTEPERPKWFGALDWLDGLKAKSPADPASEWTVFRADDLSLGSAEPTITLVRGGPPQLFGARGRLRVEYGDEFDEVQRIRGQMLLNLIGNHIGVDASVNSWEDERPGPNSLGDFWTGDANLVYSMDAQRVAMRGGAGASWIYDEEVDVGYNTTYGADLFLTRPWLVSGEIDYGKISGEKLFHWRATFGVQLLHAEVYLGYDSYKWNHIRFDGPVAGAGLWF